MAARGMWWAAQHVQAARAVSGLSPTLSEYSAANTLQTTHDGLHSVKNRHSSSWRGRWASRCAKQEHKHEKNERPAANCVASCPPCGLHRAGARDRDRDPSSYFTYFTFCVYSLLLTDI